MKIDACIDTNVMLEITTDVDLNNVASKPNTLISDPDFENRRVRVRNSLAAAWLCQCEGVATFQMLTELSKKLNQLVPGDTPSVLIPWFYTWFLKDWVLSRWKQASAMDVGIDTKSNGNEYDRYLVEVANSYQAVVISNEVKPTGAIATAAKEAGVRVMTPGAWIQEVRQHVAAVLARDLFSEIQRALPAFAVARLPLYKGNHDIFIKNCRAYLDIMKFILE
jgi:hypothetical protein